jgi:hypothetical protein
MDLNHARLPIPPRWQVDFSRRGSPKLPDQEDLRLYFTGATATVKPCIRLSRTWKSPTTTFCVLPLNPGGGRLI